MKGYFVLQYRMINRKLTDFGIKPFFSYPLFLTGFVALSILLFKKTEFAGYIYILIALSFIIKLSNTKRNDFLKICFSKKYIKIRVIENLIIALPFIFFLIYTSMFPLIIVLILLSALLALADFKISYTVTIPTPFYKKPFEFIVGFRNTFYLLAMSYALTFVAIRVNNFNLGAFAVLLILLIVSSYYAKPEDEFYVWSYNFNAIDFLKEKIKTALLFSSSLVLPVITFLAIFFFGHIQFLLLLLLLYYLYLITFILAKYSAYPKEINLPQFILIITTFLFPPALFAVIPYFFTQSLNRLKYILE
ncbi:MAG: hypothetical protein ABJB05_01450 [Parafilimonas sp.]